MKKKKSSIGCLFWIALILLVLVVFLFNRNTINNVLESTGFMKVLTEDNSEKTGTPDIEVKTVEQEKPDTGRSQKETEDEVQVIEIVSKTKEQTAEEQDSGEQSVEEQKQEEENTRRQTVEPGKKMRNARLYFIDVDDQGVIRMKAVLRPVYYIDSPLTETINTLISGLLPSELNKELITLIPEDTKLLSVTVDGGTAYLDFNEAFRFNTLGSEGLKAQLQQIVFTTTEFSTVKNVQILIEGEKQDYLGPEGVYIGTPLNRNSF